MRSAGTRAVVGAAMHPDTSAVVRDLGGEPAGFTARRLTAPMVREADLVLTMTRDHRRLALGLDPRALSRIFTLREAADLFVAGGLPTETPCGTSEGGDRTLAKLMAAGRARRASSSADDILDPINRLPDVHRDVVETIAVSLQPVVDAVRWHIPNLGIEDGPVHDAVAGTRTDL